METGWICPVCGRGVAPGEKVCPCMDNVAPLTRENAPMLPSQSPAPLREVWPSMPYGTWPSWWFTDTWMCT